MTSRWSLILFVCSGSYVACDVPPPDAEDPAVEELSRAVTTTALRPILNCVADAPDGLVAYWGYENKGATAVTIPAGATTNRFLPSPFDRGQPTQFDRGRFDKVFSLRFTEPKVTWLLGQASAEASASSTRCPTPCPDGCDDRNPCTVDTCGPAGTCLHQTLPDHASCSDGDICNGVEMCLSGWCLPVGPGPNCNDLDGCTLDWCHPTIGCLHQSQGSCDDNNSCTADACDANGGCKHTAVVDGLSCSDGNACNGEERCVAGACRAGTPPPGGCNPVFCGPTMCPLGMVCCNVSCGICTLPGGICSQQVCGP